MDTSRKLYKEDIILLNELETELLKRDKRITQKDLIDEALRFAKEYKSKFFGYIYGHKEDNRKEMVDKLLSLPKIDFGDNWMEEIDTIEHEDMLRRNKKE